jgi:biopolymer transport protein TolR
MLMGLKRRRRKSNDVAKIQITSLLDIMTILLFFLLKHYSASVDINLSKNLQLPVSTSTRAPVNALNIAVSTTEITVDGEQILALQNSSLPGYKMIPPSAFKKDPDLVLPLLDVLKKKRAYAETASALDERLKFQGDCIVQADKSTPYKLLRKVLYTAGQADYVQLNFAVRVEE